jgi:hypothetical protein
MKTLLYLLAVIIAATQSLVAQTTTVEFANNNPVTIQVPAGQIFKVSWAATSGTGSPYITINGGGSLPLSNGTTIAGPKTVVIQASGSASGSCTYNFSLDTQTATANVASQAVVVPSTGISNADIIYESSPDLVTWTAAVAGNY